MRLHLFNPANDLALAAGVAAYTPPASVQRFTLSGALLPIWWADEGDYILGDPALQECADQLSVQFGLPHVTVADYITGSADPAPWGWSASAVRQFARAGIALSQLPDERRIGRLRELSHRRSSVILAEALGVEAPIEVSRLDELERLIAGRFSDGKLIIKAPWSSSGRGVLSADGISKSELLRHAAGIIRHQRSVMVERLYPKLHDFAALYRMERGRATFVCLSDFFTSATGAYIGNRIDTDDAIVRSLGLDPRPVAESMCDTLSSLVGHDYTDGWLGVDMLTYGNPDRPQLYPCVELNLRMTMGVVAHYIGHRVPHPAIFTITPRFVSSAKSDAVPLSRRTLDLLPCSKTYGFDYSCHISD